MGCAELCARRLNATGPASSLPLLYHIMRLSQRNHNTFYQNSTPRTPMSSQNATNFVRRWYRYCISIGVNLPEVYKTCRYIFSLFLITLSPFHLFQILYTDITPPPQKNAVFPVFSPSQYISRTYSTGI